VCEVLKYRYITVNVTFHTNLKSSIVWLDIMASA
jgi:hypothetical protein